jgi:hypothetical protein
VPGQHLSRTELSHFEASSLTSGSEADLPSRPRWRAEFVLGWGIPRGMSKGCPLDCRIGPGLNWDNGLDCYFTPFILAKLNYSSIVCTYNRAEKRLLPQVSASPSLPCGSQHAAAFENPAASRWGCCASGKCAYWRKTRGETASERASCGRSGSVWARS